MGRALVPVGCLGRQFDFLSCLPQQFLGASRMATHVELVGVLRGIHTADGLVDKALRGGQVGVPVWIHGMSNGYATGDKSEDECAA